jgi:hypothetical protein
MKTHCLALLGVSLLACQPLDSGLNDGGGGGSGSGWVDLQLNDVSVLFPLTSSASDRATSYLNAASAGSRGPLLPEGLYDGIGHIAGSSGPRTPSVSGEARYADLRVVALRLDPCFADLAPDPGGAGCQPQLRLTLQELTDGPNGTQAFDSALHLFYALTRDEVVTLAQAIAALRRVSLGAGRMGSLQPHPALVHEGLEGPMARGLRALVLQYAGQSNLTRAAQFSLTHSPASWQFSAVDISDAEKAHFTPSPIASLAGAAASQGFGGELASNASGNILPLTTSTDDFSPLVTLSVAQGLDAATRSAKFEALVRVDHPGHNSPKTIDCASCHLATPVEKAVAAPTFGLVESMDPNAFQADGADVLSSELSPTFTVLANLNLHAFSYAQRDIGINQRVANESAAVVRYLNQHGH